MSSEPQVEGPPKTIADLLKVKRQWTRKQARIYVAFNVLFLVVLLGNALMALSHPSPSVFFTWWPVVYPLSMMLIGLVSTIRSKEVPLLPALRKDYVDPVYPEEETRFLRRAKSLAVAMVLTTMIAVFVSAFCGTRYYLSSRSLDDLQQLLWPVGGVFAFGTMAIIKCRAVGKRVQADWEAYVSLRDNEKAEV